MLSNLTSLIASADPVAGRRDFNRLSIFERVLDTGQRTISIDNVATISIGTAHYRIWRWLCWAIAAYFAVTALMTISGLIQILKTEFSLELFGIAVLRVMGAGVFIFVARWLEDVTYLSIGAADGSVSTFKSHDRGFLAEIKNFLTQKINEKNLTAKLAADFAAASKQPITVNHYGAVRPDIYHATVAGGSGESINVDVDSAGNAAIGNRNAVTHVDYSSVLPNIEQWQRYASQNKGWEHVAERLQEFETLLRSGTPTPDSKGQARNLAADLSTILQGYPAAIQLFQSVTRLAGI